MTSWRLGIVPPGDGELRREYIFRCAQIAALAAWAASERQHNQHNLRGGRDERSSGRRAP